MAVNLSALSASRPLTPRKIPGAHFCYRLSRPQSHNAAGRIRSFEKSTSSELEPAIFQLVAYCLNQLAKIIAMENCNIEVLYKIMCHYCIVISLVPMRSVDFFQLT
jgi:hypothetical protein